MGVYIKGIEMPTACYVCPFCDYVSARCDAVKGTPYTPADRYDKRADFCPLVPIPPHGRLIDADALVDKHFGKEFLSRVMIADEDDLGTALVNIPLVINNAPTIIPAEEGE